MPTRILALLSLLLPAALLAADVDEARKRWADSPHGPMLERLLPPTFDPKALPQPKSEGARLTLA